MNTAEKRPLDGAEGRLRSLISSVRGRWFATVALRAIGNGATAAALPAIAAGGLYLLFAPGDGTLIALSAIALIFSLAGVLTIAHGIERRPDDRRVARFIEERVERKPGAAPMNDCVVSAVQALALPPDDERAGVASLVVREADRCLDGISAATIVPRHAIRRAATVMAGGVGLLAVTLILTGPALSHAWQTTRVALFPDAVVVDVMPGDARVVAGQGFRVRARVQAGDDTLSRLTPRLVVRSDDEERTVDMTRTAEGYEFAFESVDRTFDYTVTAGPVTSSRFTVTALHPPRVKRIDVQYHYPSFSGLSPRREEDGGDIYAPAGTKVRLAIHVDKPLASAELTLGDGPAPVTDIGSDVIHADLVLAKDDSYRIRLRDRDGLQSADDSEYFIRLMDDRPPDVRILRPSADQGITPLEEVPIEARAEDDYGVSSLDLVFAVGGGKEQVVPFSRVSGTDTQRTGSHLLAAEELGVKPGDVITYYARARDIGRGKPSRQAASDIFFLEVRPFNEEFVAAQSQAGSGGGDPQLESLIEAQKEIISATWNIERRTGAGRSGADMKAVAEAQADLKARVERLQAATRGRRGRGYVPQRAVIEPQQPPATGSDGVAAVVEAMSRAIEQLAAGRTRDAIPHEMAALNGLLQAQAEVRRRQVTQQANSSGGGGWGNRQSQDLSALFDKELQRQQRTNYEQRTQVQEKAQQDGTSDSEALDRIRDLAKRQEEINRQQREAAALAAEERKRQLERLMREQQDLQRAVEQLSREMSDQQSAQPQSGQPQAGQQQAGQQQSGQQSGQQSSGQPSGRGGAGARGQSASDGQQQRPAGAPGNPGMREAAEQMRQAASDLERADATSAARRGERAAEQLRRLEEEMRGGGSGARERASADLQSEAQQILQEQRRIAAEAERLEKGAGGSTAEANRRLAADKDRLSDRVDGLQREANRLGRQPGAGTEQARAREAAGQLEQGRVAERIRQSAEQLRQGAQRPSAGPEEQVARTLEDIVQTLGGPGSNAARQLAEQLDQSRQTRERLDALEKQLREARGRGDADTAQLQQQYEQELRRAQASLGRQAAGRQAAGREQRDATGGATPETQEFSRSAPGTEAFKQDRTGWETLRKDVNRALEERDAALSRQLAQAAAEDRLAAGGSERVPEQYRRVVAKYFESLGKTRAGAQSPDNGRPRPGPPGKTEK